MIRRYTRPEMARVWAPERRLLTAGLVCLVTAGAFEGMAVPTVLPVIVDELGGLSLYGWAFSAFFLTSILGIALAGGDADRHGPARGFVAGLLLFTVGLVISGLAGSMAVAQEQQATGDQMMELTGEIADGAVLNYCVPPEYNDRALELLERGARKSGRTLADIDRPQLVVCSVDHDRERAIDTTRELLTQYLAQQPHIAHHSGVDPELVARIKQIATWPATSQDIKRAMALVSTRMVQTVTACGTTSDVMAQLERYRDAAEHLDFGLRHIPSGETSQIAEKARSMLELARQRGWRRVVVTGPPGRGPMDTTGAAGSVAAHGGAPDAPRLPGPRAPTVPATGRRRRRRRGSCPGATRAGPTSSACHRRRPAPAP